ncbi:MULTISPECIES: tryptophan synthase subunit alpha [unclassified Campylobacter]|uniref:tryptophan synthase subunit alpha n=1 Tax=unclassified Campylobacter TaxID=2593542 RepID=UPI001237E2F2|nr:MULTISPECIES: tryptophan synthase subunit alpha [unclassified Campylobacter]KAA6227119.1 tryptophan synthase subunit alpha [Campylobacter sp. LR185c]KAA6227484.1 tryptophan synthase subunit alpha [Campylobacter sp. LR196d]KAA6228510.1 tryptophan synthase subunit alpha [Campylobacter sp. LR286c]KAA6230901.1 tryptophan synthase subunit alpha [Campylobacter sp. LR291e]KAA6233535.1 tryptophan synthase subunit alpha [Campylobacter sp. LR264d]
MVDFKEVYKDNANVAYMVMGYPNLDTSKEFLNRLDESDIDILEVGVPYSDPIADGQIIANAALKAIENGCDIHKVFEILKDIKIKKSLVFMVYYNLIFSYGLASFVQKAKEVGISALIVPELSFEESDDLRKECDKQNLALITLISLSTPKERLKKLLKDAKGFIYLLACVGITGGTISQHELLAQKVEEIRNFSTLPIFIGFGIKNNQDVQRVRNLADGCIVGTSIVKLFEDGNVDKILQEIREIFKN